MRINFSDELQELLSENISSIQLRERSTFDQLASPFEKSLLLVGAGGLGRRTLTGLRKLGIEPLAFTDNNSQLWNTNLDGLKVLNPQEAVQRFGQKASFVVTIWSDTVGHPLAQIQRQFHGYGPVKVVSFAFLYWKYKETFLPYFGLDLPHLIHNQFENVRSAARLWADDASRQEYLAQIRWRLHLDFEGLPHPVSHRPYMPTDLFSLGRESVFVDCGSFDGDTIREFLLQQGSSLSGFSDSNQIRLTSKG